MQEREMAQVLRGLVVLAICGLCIAVWEWILVTPMNPAQLSAWVEPHRHAWYALPMVMLAFIALGLFPVLLLITATGIAFGPLLGPIYAMAGCLASASIGFAIGRWLGVRRVERLGGEWMTRVTRALHRNTTLAVFFVRKVPAPFTLVNIAIGASTVRYVDFIAGTLLGMGAMVIALAGFGYQLAQALRDPSPTALGGAALFVGVPLTMAWFINRTLRRARHAE
jgi:phospholipase D1/2